MPMKRPAKGFVVERFGALRDDVISPNAIREYGFRRFVLLLGSFREKPMNSSQPFAIKLDHISRLCNAALAAPAQPIKPQGPAMRTNETNGRASLDAMRRADYWRAQQQGR
jgi:hypothetical protein